MRSGKPIAGRRRASRRGFTFVELMVVITIIVILVTMAIPIYQRSITRAKESVLKNNLFTLRTVIDNYTYDKEKAPQSLQDLVSEGYLRQITVSNGHALDNFRAQTVRNLDPWYAAFNVRPGEKLYLPSDKRVRLW